MKTKLNFLRILFAIFALAVAGGPVSAEPGKSKAAERSKNAFDREAALQHRSEVHAWLKSEAISQGLSSPISVSVSKGEKLDIDMARGELPERVGLTKAVSRDFAFADVNLKSLKGKALARTHGALQETADGGYVFTAAIASPDATALRVHFRAFRLPENAGLYLYSEDGQVFGPYTGRGPHGDGDFWSHSLVGEQLYLQLRHFGAPSDEDLKQTSFNVAGVAHFRPRALGEQCSYNADCVVNLACATGVNNTAIADSELAVAHMQWISGPYIYMCSGGLLADNDTSSSIPYFLTANHCISRGKDAKNMEAFFQLTSPTCSTSCDDIYNHRSGHPQDLRTLGATIKSSNRTGDYTLMELKDPAPDGSHFLGWTTNPVASSTGTELFRISHPSGAPQSYSEHDVNTSKVQCSGWPRGNWIYSTDTYGATEGGSSGSPVVNSAGQVVGQLSGGCGYNVNDTCDRVQNSTVDGAFANYFDEIAQYIDGPACQATETVEVSCNDGADNDCDGFADGLDSDCGSSGGGGGGGETGDACEVDEECNSLRCKGKSGSKTCK